MSTVSTRDARGAIFLSRGQGATGVAHVVMDPKPATYAGEAMLYGFALCGRNGGYFRGNLEPADAECVRCSARFEGYRRAENVALEALLAAEREIEDRTRAWSAREPVAGFAQITRHANGRTADVSLFFSSRAVGPDAIARGMPARQAVDFLLELSEAGWECSDPGEAEIRRAEAVLERAEDVTAGEIARAEADRMSTTETVKIYRFSTFSRTPGNRRPWTTRYDANAPDGIGLRGVAGLETIRRLIRKHGGRPGEVVEGHLPPTGRDGRWTEEER